MRMLLSRLALLLCLLVSSASAAPVSALGARGYAVLPQPQRVTLNAADFRFGPAWGFERKGVGADDIAVTSFIEGLSSRFHIASLRPAKGGGTVTLALAPGSVTIGDALDSDKQAIADQAYQIDLAPTTITITANAAPGLFYGVQTLLQLIKPRDGALWLPEGRIVDWPDLRLRQIYWDDAHHLDRPEVLRDAIRQAAFYKINGFIIKLEGHFQYKSAPAIVEPYALSPAELQSLTDYALKRHVQLVPFLDGPSHIAFILKHPEYAKLREFPDSNYEACALNPDTYKMYEGMFQDLLQANRGVKYFYLSTDEAYYVGLSNGPACDEAARAKELGSVGKVLAEFVTKTAGWLHDQGREVVFWGEFPLKPGDIDSLPSYMINGEVYGPEFDPLFKKHGIRQTIYVSIQGEERHFPVYFPVPADKRLHTGGRAGASGKVEQVFRNISTNVARKNAELIGVVNAGWADSGLHPETFWLGYAAGTASGWHPNSPDPEESTSNFFRLFYGWNAVDMDRIYRLMSFQAQFWSDSWETGPSKARKPIWGNSNRIYSPRQPARDQFIPLPPALTVAAADLKYDSTWSRDNARRLQLAAEFLPENDELLGLLRQNLKQAGDNRYNLEVFLSVAQVLRHNLTMLAALGRMDTLLAEARDAAAKNQPRPAVAAVDQALNLAREIRDERNRALRDVTQTWYKSWYPRVPEANGRKLLHELDDVKDHQGDRTVDLSYMIQRELLLPFGDWVNQVRAARNQYAQAHNAPLNNQTFDWSDTKAAQ
jgi:hexosaminidase